MKKQLLFLFFALLALCASAAPNDVFSVGDINGDGEVNVSDVTALINKILGSSTYSDAVCDINGDGEINVSDVTALINMILK